MFVLDEEVEVGKVDLLFGFGGDLINDMVNFVVSLRVIILTSITFRM